MKEVFILDTSFKIGDFVLHKSTNSHGVIVDLDYRRDHQYLEREVYLNILTSHNQSLSTWERSVECVLVQRGSVNCKILEK